MILVDLLAERVTGSVPGLGFSAEVTAKIQAGRRPVWSGRVEGRGPGLQDPEGAKHV